MLLPRILIVDRDAELAELMREFIETQTRAAVSCVSEPHVALDQHLDLPCDVLIVDTDQQEMPFAALVNRMRAIGEPRVIVTTPQADGQEMIQAVRAGVHDVLVKPFDLEELLWMVEEQIAVRQRQIRRRRGRRERGAGGVRDAGVAEGLRAQIETLSSEILRAYRRFGPQSPGGPRRRWGLG